MKISSIPQVFNFIMRANKIFISPGHVEVLIYDREGSDAFLDYLKKNDFHILDVRGESINLYVLFKVIMKHGFKADLEKYQAEYIKLVSPKIIITFIDNTITFYRLKKYYEEGFFISVQNGSRSTLIWQIFEQEIKKDEQLRADAIFCFSSAVGKKYSQYISSKIYPHGSLLNNKYPVDISNKNNNEILYISQYRPPVINKGVPGMPIGDRHIYWDDFYSLESILLPRLNELCRLNGYVLSICGNSFNQEQQEEKFYKSFLGNNGWVYKEKTDNSSSYEKLDSPAIIASIDSTLGLEALGRGCKSMTFTGRGKITKTKDGNFGLLGNLSNQGYFWTSEVNIPEIDRVFYNVISCNDDLWQGFYKDIVPLVMEYDEGNSSLVHLIKKHLKD